MNGTDDRLRRDLKAAAGRSLPGEEFDERVLAALAEGGGERTLSADPGVSIRRRVFGGLAAAALLALAVYGIASGVLTAPEAAAPGIELPTSETAAPLPRPIRISVTSDGRVRFGGEDLDLDALRRVLAEVSGADPGRPSPRDVIIRADRRARWIAVQHVMQTCGHPSVRLNRIHWAVASEGGAKVIPVFLPVDTGLLPSFLEEIEVEEEEADAPFEEGGSGGGPGRLDGKDGKKGGWPPLSFAPDTPFQDVVRNVDRLRKKGQTEITFRAAPIPK